MNRSWRMLLLAGGLTLGCSQGPPLEALRATTASQVTDETTPRAGQTLFAGQPGRAQVLGTPRDPHTMLGGSDTARYNDLRRQQRDIDRPEGAGEPEASGLHQRGGAHRLNRSPASARTSQPAARSGTSSRYSASVARCSVTG